jgi:SAM-dependent methyltransferase
MYNQFHLITNLPFSGFSFPCQVLKRRSKLISTSLILFIFTLTTLHAQEPHVPYVTTPPGVVDKMMEMADAGPGDYVIDLGSGDGRIVIDAAKRGAVGHGVEIDPVLVNLAEENALEAGVSDKVMFLQENVFHSDFSQASVITTYMTTTLNTRLRPALLNDLNPGARVVAHDFNMGAWKADKHLKVDDSNVYLWIVPATIEGRWYWKINGKKFTMEARQQFQEIQLEVKSEDISLKVEESVLSGKNLNFTAVNPTNGIRYSFHGVVEEIAIKGLVQIHHDKEKWVEGWSATTIQ